MICGKPNGWSAVVATKTRQRAADLAPVITELRSGGVTSLRAIAAALNARSIPTATGRGVWSAVQVRRTMTRF